MPSTVVVTRAQLQQLQQQLAVAQAKAAKYDDRREKSREYDRRWREKDPEEVKRRARERVAAYRSRQRQAGQ